MTAIAMISAGASVLIAALRAQQHAPQPAQAAAGVLYRPTTTVKSSTTTAGPPAPVPTIPAVRIASPTAIDIPTIAVHSSLITLGRNPDGTVQVPDSFHVAGWYQFGVRPGAVGPAIILGHVDSKSGPGVFFRLGALKPGDLVRVGRSDGTTVTFEITGVRSYPKSQFPSIAVYGNTPTPTIRLITCGGAFDAATGHYIANTIAFGQIVGS